MKKVTRTSHSIFVRTCLWENLSNKVIILQDVATPGSEQDEKRKEISAELIGSKNYAQVDPKG